MPVMTWRMVPSFPTRRCPWQHDQQALAVLGVEPELELARLVEAAPGAPPPLLLREPLRAVGRAVAAGASPCRPAAPGIAGSRPRTLLPLRRTLPGMCRARVLPHVIAVVFPAPSPSLSGVQRALERDGLLMLSTTPAGRASPRWSPGKRLPAAPGGVHPGRREIFRVASAMEDGGAAAFVPLIDGEKVTLVQPRALERILAAIGEARGAVAVAPVSTAAARGRAALPGSATRRVASGASGPPAKALAGAAGARRSRCTPERGAHAAELRTREAFLRRAHRHQARRRPVRCALGPLGGGCRPGAMGEDAVAALPWSSGR